jgi:hypothetical protein
MAGGGSQEDALKTLPVVLAIAVSLGVAAIAGLWGAGSASAGPPLEDGLKCYRTLHVESKGPTSNPIYISDQFEEKNLIVKDPIALCTLAAKPGFINGSQAGDPPAIDDLLCYAIKDARGQNRFKPVEIETEDQFDDHNLIVNKPFALCEPSNKSVTTPPSGAGNGQILDDYAFKCYKVRRIENSSNRWEKRELDIVDQFYTDAKEVRLGRPTVFCTQVVEKKNKAKNNHIERARILNGPEDEHHASTIGTDNDRDDPPTDCAPSYGHSVWYSYTPNQNDQKVRIDTIGSTYDTVVAVYISLGGDLQEVACNDDYDYPNSGDSIVEVKLDIGFKYYIMVGSYGGDAGGKLKLNFNVLGTCTSCFNGGSGGPVAGKDTAVAGSSSILTLTRFSGHLDCSDMLAQKGVWNGQAVPGGVPAAGGGAGAGACEAAPAAGQRPGHLRANTAPLGETGGHR